MKKILLIGSTGFIGKNILENLHNRYQIDAPCRQELNALSENAIKNTLEKGRYDVVINALDLRQAHTGYLEERLRMFFNLAKYHTLYGKMIYFGSGAEYARELPISSIEEAQFDRKIPDDTYGFCLYQMNQFARNSTNIYNLRLLGIFGPHEVWQKRFISSSICKALYGYPITIRQNTLFDYLYTDDLCKMVVWMIENTPAYHDYNAVSGRKYELSAIADMINTISGSNVPIFLAREERGKEYTASNNRILSEMTDFQPETLECSIQKLVRWYQMHQSEIDKYYLLYQ